MGFTIVPNIGCRRIFSTSERCRLFLLLLFIIFGSIGKVSTWWALRTAGKAKGLSEEEVKESMAKGATPGEVFAAIAMAMHEMQEDAHDYEDTVLTIQKVERRYSPWNSKIYSLRDLPRK